MDLLKRMIRGRAYRAPRRSRSPGFDWACQVGLEPRVLLAQFLIQGRISSIVNADGIANQQLDSITDNPTNLNTNLFVTSNTPALSAAAATVTGSSILLSAYGYVGASDTSTSTATTSTWSSQINTTYDSSPTTGARTITVHIMPEKGESLGDPVSVKVSGSLALGGLNFQGTASGYIDYTPGDALTTELLNVSTTSFASGKFHDILFEISDAAKTAVKKEGTFEAKIGDTFNITVAASIQGSTTDVHDGGASSSQAIIVLSSQPAPAGTPTGPPKAPNPTNPPGGPGMVPPTAPKKKKTPATRNLITRSRSRPRRTLRPGATGTRSIRPSPSRHRSSRRRRWS